MSLLPPQVPGPHSECSRTVIVRHVIPNAEVTIIATSSGGVDRRMGSAVAVSSEVAVPIDPAEELFARETVSAYQTLDADQSPQSSGGPSVQVSVAQFSPAQVLTRLHQCSYGVILGGMRPGTEVQILHNGSVIGSGTATDGKAHVRIPNGLPGPLPAGSLVARQLICPKPPPAPPATQWVVDSGLPEVYPVPFPPGSTIPSPSITSGLTECSRSVTVTGIVAGCEVILEGTEGGWWVALEPSDQSAATLPLPVRLREGEAVSIRQELSRVRCEVGSDVTKSTVGPQTVLGQLTLFQIDCALTPVLWVQPVKSEADVEFSVTTDGIETIYRTIAMKDNDSVPAPPMSVGSIVKVRHGECDLWSPWSDPQVAQALKSEFTQPKISHEIFSCQDVLVVENISPLVGTLSVMSDKRGELTRLPINGNIMTIDIAPSFTYPDDIWVEREGCGLRSASDRKSVKPSSDVFPGQIDGPLFDGDTTVVLRNAVAGARVEIWDDSKNVMLTSGRTPLSDTGQTDVSFSGFGHLTAGSQIYAKTLHCGQFRRTRPTVPVSLHAPKLIDVLPVSVQVGHGALTLAVQGARFRSGAVVQWNGAARTTKFIAETKLEAAITAADLATAKSVDIEVRNPDGQVSNKIFFYVKTAVPPPTPGYDELRIINCNPFWIPGSNEHREIHIYFRVAGMNPPDVWSPIAESPHPADYDANGTCPAGPDSGATLALDDGRDYEVVCVDSYQAGCMTGDPDELTCRCSSVVPVRGKAGGGTKSVIVN